MARLADVTTHVFIFCGYPVELFSGFSMSVKFHVQLDKLVRHSYCQSNAKTNDAYLQINIAR